MTDYTSHAVEDFAGVISRVYMSVIMLVRSFCMRMCVCVDIAVLVNMRMLMDVLMIMCVTMLVAMVMGMSGCL